MRRASTRGWIGPMGLLLLLGCGRATSEGPPAPTAVATPTPTPASADPAPPPSSSAEGDVHGELTTVQGQRVLRVWGTPQQMGHAHGALLRTSILEIIEGYALDVIPPATLDAAGALYDSVAQVPPRLREEAQGVIEGMKAAGGAHSERLDRDLRVADLLALNAMTDLLSIGCSSVSAWGSATETEPDLGGAPVMVRNLDWSEDPQLLANQVLIVYQPQDEQRQPVVSVAFAGYLGCLSCMNEAGVSALFNMGYGDGAASPMQALGGFSPANLLLRDTLERRDVDGDGRSTADDVEATWHAATHAGSYILHVIEPRREGVPAPARVLEVEADGVVSRSAEAEGLGPTLLAATNHLRRKTEPSSCSRYDRIERTASDRQGRFDRTSLWSLGTTVRLPEVVHTLIVEPEARQLHVWLRAPGEDRHSGALPVEHAWATLMGPSTP